MPIILSLLPVLLKFAPDLVGMIMGGNAEHSVDRVIKSVQEVFGTTDADQVQAQCDADPAKADELQTRLNAETEQLRIELQDVKSARDTMVSLAQTNSLLAWAPAIVSVIVLVGFVILSVLAVYKPVDVDKEILLFLLGSWTTLTTAVVSYWVGSSLGSKDKTDQLTAIAHLGVSNAVLARKK